MDQKLPCVIKEDEEELTEDETPSLPRQVPLFIGTGSPVQRPCVSHPSQEKLCHIDALGLRRSPAPGRSPSAQPFSSEELSPSSLARLHRAAGSNKRPSNLLMPSGSCVSPLDLSPRWAPHECKNPDSVPVQRHYFLPLQGCRWNWGQWTHFSIQCRKERR